jgi:pilus assembly protein CpaB
MFKRRGLFLVVVSLVMGGMAAWAANNWVQTRLGLNGDSGEPVDTVFAAAIDIPYGTKVESRHVKPLTLPQGTAPERAVSSQESVVGAVAMTDVLRGEILMQDRFAQHETGSTLAALVGPDLRAVTVRVDDVVGVAGFLLPGNRVDVLATRLDANTRRATTETILRNLKVLAVDQTASTNQNEPVIVRAVTLEMSPPQSESLVKAKEEGTIQLTLRNPLEQDIEEPIATPEPAPAPRPIVRTPARSTPARDVTVTVIRGTTVDTTRPDR